MRKVIALALLLPNAAWAQGQAPQQQLDLCRRQLTFLHDQSDTKERDMALALEKSRVDAMASDASCEAQKSTLIEWLRAAKKDGAKK